MQRMVNRKLTIITSWNKFSNYFQLETRLGKLYIR